MRKKVQAKCDWEMPSKRVDLMVRIKVQGDFTCRVVYKVRGLLTCLRLGGM